MCNLFITFAEFRCHLLCIVKNFRMKTFKNNSIKESFYPILKQNTLCFLHLKMINLNNLVF